jgi:DNA mismatch endonuclease (patch repair protein)
MDRVDSITRSRIMSAVRSSGNKTTEWKLRAFLIQSGLRGWRVCDETLPGSPDFSFLKIKKAIFVNGCFWHGHNCTRGRRAPVTNGKYWKTKILKNKERDSRVRKKFREMGWRAMTVWECQLRKKRLEIKKRVFLFLFGRQA